MFLYVMFLYGVDIGFVEECFVDIWFVLLNVFNKFVLLYYEVCFFGIVNVLIM